MALTTQCLFEQRIPDVPQACGPNCRYTVSVPSFVFQCTPNPPSLPYGQGNGSGSYLDDHWINHTVWNGTTDPTSKWAFYVAWQSYSQSGTSGNGSCSPVQAQYDIEVCTISLFTQFLADFFQCRLKVETKGGFQSVTTSIKQTTSPIPHYTDYSQVAASEGNLAHLVSLYQLTSISYATQALFLGNITAFEAGTSLAESLKPPLLNLTVDPHGAVLLYSWGDVLGGIEEMSHNVTAAILTLSLGTKDATCSFYYQDLVYQYTPFALWVPYGVSNFFFTVIF